MYSGGRPIIFYCWWKKTFLISITFSLAQIGFTLMIILMPKITDATASVSRLLHTYTFPEDKINFKNIS
jgi:hypothetical protein